MIDGKMSQLLSGAGGASCQLCTASHDELKDLEFIRSGYPINITISSALDIFRTIDPDEFLSLPSKERFGLTHQPLSDKHIISAFPLTHKHVFYDFDLSFAMWKLQLEAIIETNRNINQIHKRILARKDWPEN